MASAGPGGPAAYSYGFRGHQYAGQAPAAPANTDILRVPAATMARAACPPSRVVSNPYSISAAYDIRKGVDYISQARDVNSYSLAGHARIPAPPKP